MTRTNRSDRRPNPRAELMQAIPNAAASKADWRTWAVAVRTEAARTGLVTADAAQTGAEPRGRSLQDEVIDHLRAWDAYRNAKRVLLYLALPGEIDLSPLAAEPTRTYLVTRTWADRTRPLTVHAYEATALERHPYGFLQPVATAAPVDPTTIELALVPGLAFDAGGARLGFGRGYYDRLLAQLSPEAIKVGVTTSHTVVPRLPAEAHDVPMDFLVTEAGVGAVVRPAAEDLARERSAPD